MSTDVFFYGTLKPGQHRWPFVMGPEAAVPASALFDNGYGWPAAVFDPRGADRVPGASPDFDPRGCSARGSE